MVANQFLVLILNICQIAFPFVYQIKFKDIQNKSSSLKPWLVSSIYMLIQKCFSIQIVHQGVFYFNNTFFYINEKKICIVALHYNAVGIRKYIIEILKSVQIFIAVFGIF